MGPTPFKWVATPSKLLSTSPKWQAINKAVRPLGIEHIAPELDDDQGTSLIFINSPTGKNLFDHIQASFTYKEVDIKLAVKYNPSAQNSAKPHPNRAKFLAHIPAWPFDEVVRSYCRDSVFVKSKRKIRKLAITILDELGVKNLIKSALAKS
ncbi:hypothetical protein [Sunxiuqinia elliptica]|uniref:hypothetical protein n=1 Tax=Sunxiuqinia elliptica TaxID=655355 RepID=UPI001061AEC7|nr:hypothetical protein [Sunxiuqinia elliptica]